MSTYDILSIDPINIGENIMVSVYIKPDFKLLQIIQNSFENNVEVLISGTQFVSYDNIKCHATIDQSFDISPNREKLMNGTGIYILTTSLPWNGYPLHNGKITILNETKTQEEQTISNNVEETLNKICDDKGICYITKKKEDKKDDNKLIRAVLMLLLFILVIYLLKNLNK